MAQNPSVIYQLSAERRRNLLAEADARRRAATAPVVRHHRMARFVLSIVSPAGTLGRRVVYMFRPAS